MGRARGGRKGVSGGRGRRQKKNTRIEMGWRNSSKNKGKEETLAGASFAKLTVFKRSCFIICQHFAVI
jgi:hypothetical protein